MNKKYKNFKLCIVVGHSIKKTGAYNKDLNITEYFLNQELSQTMAYECIKRDIPYIIHYRLNGYFPLPSEINKLNPTHTICVHHNSDSKKSVNGTETLYWKYSKVSDTFAKCVNDEIVSAIKTRNRGIKGKVQGDRGGIVLRNTAMPCILLEPYFMSNNEAIKKREVDVLAKAIIDGYCLYIGSK